MQTLKQSNLSSISGGFLWFGAAISIAEILTGMLIAPLGVVKGTIAIILGHVIGCALLFFTGLIGGKTKNSAMQIFSFSFGSNGSKFFSILNVLQLVGWTGVMIAAGAEAVNSVTVSLWQYSNHALWCVVLGLLLVIWVISGLKKITYLTYAAVISLFIMMIWLSIMIFAMPNIITQTTPSTISFGQALELSIMMPISWLPLISDYTKSAKHPFSYTLTAVLCYFIGSIFMYLVGLASVSVIKNSDISTIFAIIKLSWVAISIIILSTVTTTFLDIYSASVSFSNIYHRPSVKFVGIVVTICGVLLAALVPASSYENFLYLIGAVFTPAATILLTDYYILKRKIITTKFIWSNFAIWLCGYYLYNLTMTADLIVGNTIIVMIVISALCIAYNFVNNFLQEKHVKPL